MRLCVTNSTLGVEVFLALFNLRTRHRNTTYGNCTNNCDCEVARANGRDNRHDSHILGFLLQSVHKSRTKKDAHWRASETASNSAATSLTRWSSVAERPNWIDPQRRHTLSFGNTKIGSTSNPLSPGECMQTSEFSSTTWPAGHDLHTKRVLIIFSSIIRTT